jgi:putative ABC transport system permease protein
VKVRAQTPWERWIALCLWCYPRRFRQRFGADLSAQYCEPATGRSIRAALQAASDLARGGLGARADDLCAAWSVRATGSGVDGLLVDLRHGLKSLTHRPLFALMVIATFALAASLNAAVFAILDTTLLRPLPVRDDASVVSIGSEWINFRHSSVSVPEYLDYGERSRTLSPMAALTSASFNLVTTEGVPERVLGARVTASFFEVLGAAPALGRVFTPAEDRPGAPGVALVSHRFWMRRLGGNPGAVGQPIRFDGGERLIIGVMPREFRFPAATTDVWTPLSINPADPPSRGSHNRQVLARLVPGASLARARDEMHAIAKQLAHEHPQVYPPGSGWDVSLLPFREYLFGSFQAPLATLMAAVAFVLLIACANVANLLVARATERATDLATRAALGASGLRLARQAAIEGLMLGICGGAAGLAAGAALVRALVAFFPEALPVPDRVLTDPRIALFTLLITAAAGVLAALVTRLKAFHAPPGAALRHRRASPDAATQRVRSVLTVTEIALSVMLLMATGVALRSFVRLTNVNPGHEIAGVATARMTALTRYASLADVADYYQRLTGSVAARPGVRHAGLVSYLPLSGQANDWGFEIENYTPPNPGQPPDEQMRSVAGDYFQAMGVPLLSGRLFDWHDRSDRPRVAIVSALLAKKYFGDTNPLGRRLRFHREQPWITIAGVVGDVRNHGLDEAFVPILYVPAMQQPERTMSIVARLEPGAGASVIADAIRAVEPHQPIFAVHMMEDWVFRSVAASRFNLLLLGLFAVLGILLAAVGVYGVMAFTVSRRTRELGIRVALGAEPTALLTLVLGRSLLMAAAGVLVGLAAGLGTTLLLRTMFHGVQILDPIVFATVSVLVLTVAVLASYAPARRAMRIDPLEALRTD